MCCDLLCVCCCGSMVVVLSICEVVCVVNENFLNDLWFLLFLLFFFVLCVVCFLIFLLFDIVV